ncbi:hypothetical protein GCM10009785_33700 [Brooklawnia cerclae]|uniref:Uncharacterized protein n=1 Tax=Brooklawnia cerclae TaxID=349934 RepID=A0ABX0SG62_9ACTN|nr:DUF6093 family protein [Brooklawnia cerclae]NIH55716.1 hypothetical protein [Brooklawnia cerclae]
MRPQSNVLRRKFRMSMTLTARLQLKDGELYDPVTNMITPNWVTLYEGPAWLKSLDRFEQAVSAGQPLTVSNFELRLPMDTSIPAGELRAIITSAPGDPALPGVELSVVGAVLDDWGVARRLPCVRVT